MTVKGGDLQGSEGRVGLESRASPGSWRKHDSSLPGLRCVSLRFTVEIESLGLVRVRVPVSSCLHSSNTHSNILNPD